MPQSVQHELGDFPETLKNLLGEDVFAAWFCGSKLIGVSGDIVTISVATPFYKSRIVANFELRASELSKLLTRPSSGLP